MQRSILDFVDSDEQQKNVGERGTACVCRERMRQTTLCELLGLAKKDESAKASVSLEVFDLFCGAGGFSAGAAAAGCRIAFACDADENALETHRRNHPRCVHLCAQLPVDNLAFPIDGRNFHLHGSPPCQQFSSLCTRGRTSKAYDAAVGLVEWFVDLAVSSAASSWSMEEVPHPAIIAILDAAHMRSPCKLDYEVFDLSALGVPQTRRRLLAGSPHLINRLRRHRFLQVPRCVRDVLPWARGTHIKNSLNWTSRKRNTATGRGMAKFIYKKCSWHQGCHSIDGLAPTVNAARNLSWVTFNGAGVIHMPLRARELAALQTFPADYKLPESSLVVAMAQIGNALPPRVAMLLMGPDPDDTEDIAMDETEGRRCSSPSLMRA